MDILVQTEDGPRAIEIETGKSDAKANVEKCERAGVPLTLVATEREVERRLQEALPADITVLSVLDPILPPWNDRRVPRRFSAARRSSAERTLYSWNRLIDYKAVPLASPYERLLSTLKQIANL